MNNVVFKAREFGATRLSPCLFKPLKFGGMEGGKVHYLHYICADGKHYKTSDGKYYQVKKVD